MFVSSNFDLFDEHNTFPFAFDKQCVDFWWAQLHLRFTYSSNNSISLLPHLLFLFFLFFLILFILIFFLKHVLFLNLNESNITLEILFDTSEIILSKNREMIKNQNKRKTNLLHSYFISNYWMNFWESLKNKLKQINSWSLNLNSF